MPRLPRAFAALALGAVLVVPACSSSSSSGTSSPTSSSAGGITPVPTTAAGATPTTTAGATAGTAITIKSFAFQPAELKAKVGDTVTVTNDDGTNHSVTAVDGSFDTDPFSTGSKTFTLTKAGRFEYKCKIHSFMPHAFIQVT